MDANFPRSLAYTFGWEGGYGNHPSDPGGPTNWGITIHDYRRYINPNGTANDVKKMTRDQAAQIYKERYWDLQHCEQMPSGLDFAMFDYGVNSGIGRSQKALQRILKVTPDGIIGQKTLTAIRLQDTQFLILALCQERLRFVRSLKTWKVFGAGWGRRIAGVQQQALGLMKGKPL
jgi:lysozyme family protein